MDSLSVASPFCGHAPDSSVKDDDFIIAFFCLKLLAPTGVSQINTLCSVLFSFFFVIVFFVESNRLMCLLWNYVFFYSGSWTDQFFYFLSRFVLNYFLFSVFVGLWILWSRDHAVFVMNPTMILMMVVKQRMFWGEHRIQRWRKCVQEEEDVCGCFIWGFQGVYQITEERFLKISPWCQH